MPDAPRTKIIATVGPACAAPEVLRGMVEASADVFRVNGAHATSDEIGTWVERVRQASDAVGVACGVWVDLPGTKIRVGALRDDAEVELSEGATLRLDGDEGPGDAERLPLGTTSFFPEVEPGAVVVLGDGSVRLEVVRAESHALVCRVVAGGRIRPGAGVHLPDVEASGGVPTRRDRQLAQAALAAGADWIGQSFVRSVDDVARLKEHLASHGGRHVPVLAKIEHRGAVDRLDSILARADGVVVARGDLGIDAGPAHVPSLQRRILAAGRRAGRPVVIATEMLESMTRRVRPTRAEASDVAGAVFDGGDAVMLSAETAVGAHPVLVVQTMARILDVVERDPEAPYFGSPWHESPARKAGRPDQHVVRAAVSLAAETNAAAIVVFTRSGQSAIRLSKERPAARIHAFAAVEAVCRRLALAWGVRAECLPPASGDDAGTDAVVGQVVDHLRQQGLRKGDRAVLVMGGAKDPAGATTLIKLETL